MTRLTCPHCGRVDTTPKDVPARAGVCCPACHELFRYEVEATPAAAVETARPITARAEPVRHGVAEPMVVRPAADNGLATAALYSGIFSVLVCWVPFFGLQLALLAGSLGILLGVIGLVRGALDRAGQRSGLAASGVGAGLGLVGIVLSLAITAIALSVFYAITAPEPATWVTVPDAAQLGHVEVRVLSAKVANVPLTKNNLFPDTTGEGQSQEPALIVTLQVTNTTQTRKFDYKGFKGRKVPFLSWAEGDFPFDKDNLVTLEDNLGNSYKQITYHRPFGISHRPVGGVKHESLYPGKALTDVLIFQRPVANAESLELQLSAWHVGAEGVFGFRIPVKDIEQ